MPLVVHATGYGGVSMNWSGLTDHWVRAGYVVAAPTFPLSCKDTPGGTSGADLPSQPGDVAFVAARGARSVHDRDSEMAGLVNPDRVALAGKSFGAIAVLEAGFNPAEQVRRTFPRSWHSQAWRSKVHSSRPSARRLLLAHGDEDALVPCRREPTHLRTRTAAEVLPDVPRRRPPQRVPRRRSPRAGHRGGNDRRLPRPLRRG